MPVVGLVEFQHDEVSFYGQRAVRLKRGKSSQFVADLAQETFPPGHIGFAFDTERGRAVDNSHDPAALGSLRNNYLGRIRRGTKHTADFGNHLERIQHVEREETFA